nr:hypothetical protein GCM10010200_020350 [Actinomadura rugatobispora]
MTCANATAPDALTAPAWYGSWTAATCGPALSAATACPTAARADGSVSRRPSGAANTTRAVAPPPAACGKRSSSMSIARCASVPGIEKALSVGPDRVAAAVPLSPSSSTQTSRTQRRRRKANRPSR